MIYLDDLDNPTRIEGPTYVVIAFQPDQPGRFRRELVSADDSPERARERAEHLRDVADRGDRKGDTYEVYELRKVEAAGER